MRQAACLGSAKKRTSNADKTKDPFFPGRGETDEEAILSFCFWCKVRTECSNYADRIDAKVGVWGGQRRTRATHGTESERRKSK